VSWLDSAWTYRQAIVVDNTSGSATIDVTATIPSDFDPFWDNVLASGFDIRITLADGKTLATYDVDSFNKVNRTCTLEVDNLAAASTDAMLVLWLYWGNALAGDGATTFTPSGAKTGYIVPDCMPAGYVVAAGAARPGDLRPSSRIQKTVEEELHVWFDLRPLLARRNTPFAGSPLCEEIEFLQLDVKAGGVSQAPMFDEDETRVITPGLVRTSVKAGNDTSDYTITLTVKTTEGKILNPRALLLVRDLDEA